MVSGEARSVEDISGCIYPAALQPDHRHSVILTWGRHLGPSEQYATTVNTHCSGSGEAPISGLLPGTQTQSGPRSTIYNTPQDIGVRRFPHVQVSKDGIGGSIVERTAQCNCRSLFVQSRQGDTKSEVPVCVGVLDCGTWRQRGSVVVTGKSVFDQQSYETSYSGVPTRGLREELRQPI